MIPKPGDRLHQLHEMMGRVPHMADTLTPQQATTGIHVPAWAWLVLMLALLATFVMLQENGLVLSQWKAVHELFHDGRHGLGFPCH